jgi:toxin FitB
VTYLIDTNVISELRKRMRAHPSVLRWVMSTPPHEHHTSVLVIGELRRGVELKRRYDKPQATALEKWLNTVIAKYEDRILPVDQQIAEAWGRMGIPDPVPDIDGILAATALVHGLTLVTRERKAAARFGVPVLNPFVGQ